jgi:hypothetical protein
MPCRPRRAGAWPIASAIGLALGCASPDSVDPAAPAKRADAHRAGPPAGTDAAADAVRVDARGTYLRPNAVDRDGTPAFVHVTEADMPLRVAVGEPKDSPRYGSRAQAREATREAIALWQDAIQPELPWFRIDFVDEDPGAQVQIEWKRRIPGPWGGFGRLVYGIWNGRLRVGGKMEVAIRPDPFIVLKVEEVRRLIAHEFGHVLGLGHCLDCDSAMNYAWYTRDRTLVTAIDTATFVALVSTPNGRRVDGRPMQALLDLGWRP